MNYHEKSTSQTIDYRKSGFLLAGIIAFAFAVALLRGKPQPYVAVVVAVIVLLALFDAKPLRKAIVFLISLGNSMNRFTNPLVFGMIYIVSVVPTAFVLRLLKKDILHLRYDSKAPSYWKDRLDGKVWKESFYKQY